MNRVSPSELEDRVDELSRRLNAIEGRLAELERAPGVHTETESTPRPPLAVPSRRAATVSQAETLARIGRTLLVLAGAFLLRAVTEAGVLPLEYGTALGLVYAGVWLAVAGRAAGRERSVDATFHALAAGMIGFPLTWEATVKFGLLSPAVGASAVLLVAGAGLVLAAWRRLAGVAWIFALGAASTALALCVATRSLTLFVGLLLLLGLATLWLGYERGWPGPGWTVAAIVDGAVLLLGVMVLVGRPEQVWEIVHPQSVVTIQLALVLIYCGSVGARTLASRLEVGAAEVLQSGAALIVGLGGAIAVSLSTGFASAAIGAVTSALAVGCYAAAFAFIDRHGGGRRNFIFFSTLALVFALVMLAALTRGAAFSWTLAALAVLTAWLGTVRGRATLTLHGAVYIVVAAFGSGLLATSFRTMVTELEPALERLTLTAVVVLLAAAICAGLPVATHGRTWGGFSRVPKLVVLIVVAFGTSAAIVALGSALLPRAEDTAADPAALAALRTGALAATALGLAWVGRLDRFVEGRWLVYPALVAGGAKVLLEDVAAGRAATLVLSFALYGGALIVAPRLLRRKNDDA